jgi:hypothetical protein
LEEEIQMAKIYVKKCSIFIAIEEMQKGKQEF